MQTYTVLAVARSPSGPALCLAAAGGYHVARATADVPPVGARLLGNAPALGFGLLLGAPLDQVFRVIFEAVHCSHDEVQSSFHGHLDP